jgi:O-antigen/teichoic acid export membrane protein
LVISLLIYIAKDFITAYLGISIVVPLIIALFVRMGSQLGLAILRAELRVGETAFAMILRPLGWLVVGWIFVSFGSGVRGIVYGYIAGSLAMLIVAWKRVSISPSWPSLEHAKSLFDYGRYSIISAIGAVFYNRMDVAILSIFVALNISSTRSAIGAYENAWRISTVILIVASSVATTLFPQISRWDSEDAIEKIEDVIPTALFPALMITIPAAVGASVFSKEILGILFGPEFTVAWVALIILVSEKFLQSIHIVLSRCLQAINRPDLAAYATIVAIITNLSLNILLIYHFGIIGAAVATTVSFAANTVLHFYYLSQFIKIRIPIRETIWSAISSIGMGGVLFLANTRVQISTLPQLVIFITIGFLIYGFIVLAYYPVRSRVWTFVKPIIEKKLI